jgi:peptide/nickel transport system permease protein
MTRSRRLLLVASRNLLAAIPTAGVLLVAYFFLFRLAPGDAADVFAAESGAATTEMMEELRERFGLNAPVLEQLLNYVSNLARGDLGMSPRYGLPVSELIMSRLPATLLLMAVSLSLALFIGIGLGALMASRAGRWTDRAASIVVLVLYSVPGFWIGLMLIVLFSIVLGWLPSGGSETVASGYSGWELFVDRARHIVLPAITLALFYVAVYARLTRAAFLEIAELDFVKTARAKGVPPLRLALRHVLPNALLPVTTVAGIHIGGILGGAVVVETVFSWPGLGRLSFDAIMQRDFGLLLGIVLLSSLMVIVVNLLVDLFQAWLDPRIEGR